MARRGTEQRQKTHQVLVRMTEAEHQRVTVLAESEGTARAEYLRRRIESPTRDDVRSRSLSEIDRRHLAGLTRSMGHLAGLMKLATLKVVGGASSLTVREFLKSHHHELQELQRAIRAFLEREQ